MTAATPSSRLGKERLGLIMIAASLLGIAAISYIITDYQNTQRLLNIRTEGVSLVRLLSRVSYDDLVSQQGSANVLEALVYAGSNDNDGVLYAAVVDRRGQFFNQASQSGVFAPPFPDIDKGGLLASEKRIRLESSGVDVLEFHGPLIKAGEPAGYVRLGYQLPGGLSMGQLPFLGTLALVVFLITTLAYILFRREIRPIRQLEHEMLTLIQDGNLRTVSIDASGEMAEFMKRFNTFVDLAQNRIQTLEDQESRLVSSKKLIRYRRNRVEKVLESLPYGIMVFDENGAVTFLNTLTGKMLGVELAEIRENEASQWMADVSLVTLLTEAKQRCRSSFALEPIEIKSPCADGKTLEVSARQVVDGGGAVVIIRDATQDAQARKSRGEFVAHIAHELKTPLNTLALYSEGLQSEEGANPNFRLEATNVISDEVERLANLISNLLSITKIETGSLGLSRSLVKPRDLLVDVFETVKRSCRKPAMKFEILLPAEMGPIKADKDLLRIAINNLLTNAVKYNRPDGVVTLAAEETDDSLIVEVRDTGIGIEASDQERIFEKFFRSDNEEVRSRSGHGLGLSLTRDIIQIHNGVLEVSSQPGKGSQFKLVLWKDASGVRQAI